MAEKFKRGLPSNFVFEPITPVDNLGDYLDETRALPAPSSTKAIRPESTGARPTDQQAQTSSVRAVTAVTAPMQTPEANEDQVERRALSHSPATVVQPTEQRHPPRHTGPRREINMSPETLRMSDELLELIRGGSGQRDTKANELVHALVLLAFEAKDNIDPYTIPKRGRWGTPTARAYPLELKNAILQALLKKHT